MLSTYKLSCCYRSCRAVCSRSDCCVLLFSYSTWSGPCCLAWRVLFGQTSACSFVLVQQCCPHVLTLLSYCCLRKTCASAKIGLAHTPWLAVLVHAAATNVWLPNPSLGCAPVRTSATGNKYMMHTLALSVLLYLPILLLYLPVLLYARLPVRTCACTTAVFTTAVGACLDCFPCPPCCFPTHDTRARR